MKPDLISQAIEHILSFIGEDPTREGLLDTPKRVAKAYAEMFEGYTQNVEDYFKVFEVPHREYDELIISKDIPFFSVCEHHMLSFSGVAHIGYIPDQKVLGLSKFSRILDVYAKRLQIQERIGKQVVEAIMQYLNPLGAGCIIEASHLCMQCRGVKKSGSTMVTSALAGVFKNQATRQEFLSLIKS